MRRRFLRRFNAALYSLFPSAEQQPLYSGRVVGNQLASDLSGGHSRDLGRRKGSYGLRRVESYRQSMHGSNNIRCASSSGGCLHGAQRERNRDSHQIRQHEPSVPPAYLKMDYAMLGEIVRRCNASHRHPAKLIYGRKLSVQLANTPPFSRRGVFTYFDIRYCGSTLPPPLAEPCPFP
jgi:hypothetical protein